MERLRLESFHPHLLAPCDLGIEAGGTATLTGPSGSGKSLFLRAVADLDPHGGTAWLDGRRCEDFTPPDWRRSVGYLPAESHWWGERVGDHLAARDDTLIDTLGLPAEVFDWPVSRLSSGERQRLAIARLLAVAPRVLLLDEPTANLDRDSTARVEEVVRDYQRETGAGVIWVSHDPEQRERVGGTRWTVVDGAVREATP
jgi:ABC-type iron transport system FetAB ATPase subunit